VAKTFQEATLRVVSIFVFRCLLGITGVIPCGGAKKCQKAILRISFSCFHLLAEVNFDRSSNKKAASENRNCFLTFLR
jgi:hypothetical protein